MKRDARPHTAKSSAPQCEHTFSDGSRCDLRAGHGDRHSHSVAMSALRRDPSPEALEIAGRIQRAEQAAVDAQEAALQAQGEARAFKELLHRVLVYCQRGEKVPANLEAEIRRAVPPS